MMMCFVNPINQKGKYTREKVNRKGRVFIKVVMGKNKNGKKGKKRDLETAFQRH